MPELSVLTSAVPGRGLNTRDVYQSSTERHLLVIALSSVLRSVFCLDQLFFEKCLCDDVTIKQLNDIAVLNKSSQSCKASVATWDHTVFPATRHR